ncbi:MAG TPA: carbon starvation protein A [Candidatus Alistipes intestinigallinarum]|uniref:Carbon starvation protein A n=1 Tax=Candidatus Alistipes intestinigallinarum TaxID=2838440 RepID=A0A9D1Z0W9_9BACT|nr:carbon starvation protein A [Candidatus Alistipes intestinigallinarum]
MITFLVCLALLITAYFTYGRYLERLVGINPAAETPCSRLYDGVDYVPLPRWRIFLIQLLNIAGLGPIFGAVLGAAYGPVAFLWITLGGIFMGAMHDFVAGVISLRQDGASLPEITGHFLGRTMKLIMRLFSAGLMILVGAVFLSQPAELIANRLDIPSLEVTAFGDFSWLLLIILGIILIYYIAATLLPVDKIIGRIYPIFGFALLFMALGILFVLLFSGDYTIPELTSLRNCIADAEKFPIVPMLFTTIACGAISGFHATQSPLMARCMRNERESRSVFYGAMISESIIALIWAAIGMAFWGGVEGLNAAIAEYKGSAAILIDIIATKTLGPVLAGFVIFGVVACAVTSGDTAFRSARLIVADFMGVEQRSLRKRIYICIPLFALGLLIIFGLPFQAMWSYFAWMNQTLAAVTLWMIVVYLGRRRRGVFVGLIPALIMTYVCGSYVFVSPLMFGMTDRPMAYLLGGAVTLAILIVMVVKIRREYAKGEA